MRYRVIVFFVATLSLFSLAPISQASRNFTVGGDRPVLVRVSAHLKSPAPLIIMLHSASTNGGHQERYMKLAPVAASLGAIYIAPNGTLNKEGKRTWNASKSCCQGPDSSVDDLAYINSLIDSIDERLPIDRQEIILIGHSNGAFMALQYACLTGHAAAVISLAGAMDEDFKCAPKKPFAFLHIHGTNDATIKFSGGVMRSHRYTSATETVARVAANARCTKAISTPIDFEPSIQGRETTAESFQRCSVPISFWKIEGGSHSPKLPRDFAKQVLTFAMSAVD